MGGIFHVYVRSLRSHSDLLILFSLAGWCSCQCCVLIFDGSKGEHMSRRKGLESPMIKKASSQESNYVESRLRGVAITVHA